MKRKHLMNCFMVWGLIAIMIWGLCGFAEEILPEPTTTAELLIPAVETVSPIAESAMGEATAEPAEEPIVEEAIGNPVEEPIIEDTTTEPTEDPAVEKATTDPLVEDATAEPTEEPVVEEVIAEPTEEPIVEEATSEPTEVPVVGESTAEPTMEPIAEEATAAPTETPAYTDGEAEVQAVAMVRRMLSARGIEYTSSNIDLEKQVDCPHPYFSWSVTFEDYNYSDEYPTPSDYNDIGDDYYHESIYNTQLSIWCWECADDGDGKKIFSGHGNWANREYHMYSEGSSFTCDNCGHSVQIVCAHNDYILHDSDEYVTSRYTAIDASEHLFIEYHAVDAIYECKNCGYYIRVYSADSPDFSDPEMVGEIDYDIFSVHDSFREETDFFTEYWSYEEHTMQNGMCTGCGYAEEAEDPCANGHTWGEAFVEDGYEKQICEVCGTVAVHTQPEAVECTHEWKVADNSRRTQHPDHLVGMKCSLCNATMNVSWKTNVSCCYCAGSHNWEWVTSKSIICRRCGITCTGNDEEIYTQVLKALPGEAMDDPVICAIIEDRLLDADLNSEKVFQIISTLKDADNPYSDLYVYSFFDYKFGNLEDADKSAFNHFWNKISLSDDVDADQFLSLWFHESAHAIDWNAGNDDDSHFTKMDSNYQRLYNALLSDTVDVVVDAINTACDRVGIDLTNQSKNKLAQIIIGADYETELVEGRTITSVPNNLSADEQRVYEKTLEILQGNAYTALSAIITYTQDEAGNRKTIYRNKQSVMVMDILGGMTNNTVLLALSHLDGDGGRENYWFEDDGKPTYAQCTEAFAEFFSAQILGDQDIINANEEYFGETCAVLEEYAWKMLEYYKNNL